MVDGGTRRAECCLSRQVEALYGKEEGKPSFDFVPSLGFQHKAGIEAGSERDLISFVQTMSDAFLSPFA